MASLKDEMAMAIGDIFDDDILPGQQSIVNDYPDAIPSDQAQEPPKQKPKRKPKAEPKQAQESPKVEPKAEASSKEYKLSSFYVLPDDLKRYKALAQATGTTLSKLTGEAVKQYAEELEKKLSPEQRAVYDALIKL